MTWEIVREILSYVITGLSTAIAGGTFIHFKAKRKTENQKARQEENTADAGKFQNLQAEIKFMDERLDKYRTQQIYQEEQSKRRTAGLQRTMTLVIGQKKYAEYHICKDIGCPDRMPVLGTFKTEDAQIDEENERDSKKSSS